MAASAREVQNLQTTVVALQGNPVAPNPPVVGDLLVWDGSAWTPQPPAAPMGVTDGSQAAPGQVGEILTATVPVSVAFIPNGINESPGFSLAIAILSNALPLTNGDWQVYIDYNVSATLSLASATQVYASMQSGSFGDAPSLTRIFAGWQGPNNMGNGFSTIGISCNYTFPQVNVSDASSSKAVWAQFNNTVIGLTNVTISGNAFFWARRMR